MIGRPTASVFCTIALAIIIVVHQESLLFDVIRSRTSYEDEPLLQKNRRVVDGAQNLRIAPERTEKSAEQLLLQEFSSLNNKLLGPDSHGIGCPESCGCSETRTDCPRWYKIEDVVQSSKQDDPVVIQEMAVNLTQAKTKAKISCNGTDVLEGGGWCLTPDINIQDKVEYQNISYPMATGHVKYSDRVVKELSSLIQSEGITSINDFGAGIGQYKAALLEAFPTGLDYFAYDGAGNIEEYTQGLVKFFDLTLPLSLPVTDWVVSLEVGEHVPSKYEGMVIRNLHRHNRKGIILSWSILGQHGTHHINNHSNDYIKSVLQELGYSYDYILSSKFRTKADNYWWFEKSVMVFRRTRIEGT